MPLTRKKGLNLSTLGNIFSKWPAEIFFLFFPEDRFWYFRETICMKYQILFPRKNKKNIMNLSSVELTKKVEKINFYHSIAFFKQKVLMIFLFLHKNIPWAHSVDEALLVSTHVICFCGEVRNNFTWYPHLSRAVPPSWKISRGNIYDKKALFDL